MSNVKKEDLRQVTFGSTKAYFHIWVKRMDMEFNAEYAWALVELENGSMQYIPAVDIKFIS